MRANVFFTQGQSTAAHQFWSGAIAMLVGSFSRLTVRQCRNSTTAVRQMSFFFHGSRPAMHLVDGVRFRCTGLFYDWRADRADFAKRAILEIFRDDQPAPGADSNPDAIVVMMNPGSSAPLAGYGQPEFAGQRVPAKPDAVQYQVMRLMAAAGWQHARVVNLADVRAAKSADLYALIESGATPADLGAMFAGASCVPTTAAVASRRVICAWGMDKRLAPYARQAQAWLDAQGITPLGVQATTSSFPAYRYPKPVGNWNMAVEWLATLKAQVGLGG